MKYLDNKAFMVGMPGKKAVHWPRCDAKTWDGVVCELELGHTGKHKGINCVGDAQYDVEWVNAKCGALCPDDHKWECRLDLGHAGKHKPHLRDGYLPDCDGIRPVEWVNERS